MPGLFKKKSKRLGFSLIEVLLALFLILALVSILLTISAVYKHSRNTALQSYAVEIATRDIETQRTQPFANISSGAIVDSDSAKLPSYNGQRTVVTYDDNTRLKQITDVITWVEKGAARRVTLETIISEYGL